MSKVKFAVVGCGHIGKKHAEVIIKNNDAELTALIDIKDLETLKLQHFHVPCFSSLKDFLISNIQTDVINIATPNGLHAQQAFDCLNAGKHVVIEKPIALHATAAKKIIDAAKEKQKKVFVVMQNRYSAPVAWLKQIVTDKIFGEIFSVQLNCF